MNTSRYRLLADIVFWFHGFITVAIIVNLLMLAAFDWYFLVGLTVALAVFASQLVWRGCPLTILENWLRSQYDPASVKVSFLGSFAERFGYEIPPRFINTLIAALAVLTIMLYIW